MIPCRLLVKGAGLGFFAMQISYAFILSVQAIFFYKRIHIVALIKKDVEDCYKL